MRQARTLETGSVDLSAFNTNSVLELSMPLFVQLKGEASNAATGSAVYRLGNTVIGAIHGYANNNLLFNTANHQSETSAAVSHSFGSFYVEGQIGYVSINNDIHHLSDLSGVRSQITLGIDSEFVSPFAQVSHHTLTSVHGSTIKTISTYIGFNKDIVKLTADTYSIDTRLWTKAGLIKSQNIESTGELCGSIEWSSSLKLNNGIMFSTNLDLNTISGSTTGLKISLDR